MSFDSKQQRAIFGRVATGVTVAGVHRDGEDRGMTANAVTSVSLDPPLVLVCVAKKAEFQQWIAKAGAFSLSILDATQQELSDRFAYTGPKDFSGLEIHRPVTGAPVLAQCLGWVDCQTHEVLSGGDHDVFVGRIVAGGCSELPEGAEPKPLLYFFGGYRQLQAAP